MLSYVDCGEKEAAWVVKFFMWVFIFDDRLDDITNFSSPEKSAALFLELNLLLMWSFPDNEQMNEKFVEFLDERDVADRSQTLDYLHAKLEEARQNPGTVYDTSSPQVHPLAKAFRDLWAQLCKTMPADSLRRWAIMFQNQLLANVQEIRNHKTKTIPTLDEYIACRRESVSTLSCSVLIEFLDKAHLPDQVFDCPEMQRFLVAFADFVSWHNDLCSFQKEAMLGDVYNLVIVLSHAEGCSYAEAGIKVHQMILDKIVEMEKAIGELGKVTPPEYQHAISRYVHFTRTFVTATYYWHDKSARYMLKESCC